MATRRRTVGMYRSSIATVSIKPSNNPRRTCSGLEGCAIGQRPPPPPAAAADTRTPRPAAVVAVVVAAAAAAVDWGALVGRRRRS